MPQETSRTQPQNHGDVRQNEGFPCSIPLQYLGHPRVEPSMFFACVFWFVVFWFWPLLVAAKKKPSEMVAPFNRLQAMLAYHVLVTKCKQHLK